MSKASLILHPESCILNPESCIPHPESSSRFIECEYDDEDEDDSQAGIPHPES